LKLGILKLTKSTKQNWRERERVRFLIKNPVKKHGDEKKATMRKGGHGEKKKKSRGRFGSC